MSIYEFKVKTITGKVQTLSDFQGKVLLIVNTASKCSYTPQFSGLQKLYETYCNQGFEILGFPCNQFLNQELEKETEISQFCQLNYGVTFPMFAKIHVNGPDAHPLFQYLTAKAPGLLGSKAIKWNFTKFLIDRNGHVIKRYAPSVAPKQIEEQIRKLLQS